MPDYSTPCYDKLSRDKLVLGVSNGFVSMEMMLIGFAAFVMRDLLIPISTIAMHIIIATLNKKEKEWKEIARLLLKLPRRENAIIP